jgi:hypothetical protein
VTEAARDSRTFVTRDAFQVDPKLLGLRLASPWRRLVALGIDFALIALLTAALSDVTLLVWAVIAFLLVGVALKRSRTTSTSTRPAPGALLLRTSVGCLGVLILSIVMLVWGLSRMSEGEREEVISNVIEQGLELPITVGGVTDSLAAPELRQATPDQALAALERAAARLEGSPLDREARTAVLTVSVPADAAWAGQADSLIEIALDRTMTEAPLTEAQLDTIEDLEERVEALTTQLESERRTMASVLSQIWDQVGSLVGLWSLYFAVLLPRLNGQTIGKRLLGVRVMRLDGQPITWWSAVERAGGYAAGLATGLLGFAQIFWDRNRMCIHDKIVETVVVEAQPRMAP